MSSITTTKTLVNPRLITVLLLGFSSGIPLALTSSTLQAWFTEAHISVVTIGALSLLGVPYAFKFLWAPLMDHYRIPMLGRRRGFIMLMQLGLVLTLLLLGTMNPSSQAASMGLVALVVAFFSASQDVSIDAYRTDVLRASERGLGASYFVFGYRVAMLISGGVALICADYLGWKATYELMAFLILLSMIPAYKGPLTTDIPPAATNAFGTIVASLGDLLQRDRIILLLLFVMFYKLGDALALSLMTNFLLHGLGFSLTEVGLAYKMVSFIAVILGCFTGGILLTRWNIYYALLIFGLLQSFSNLTFVILSIVGKHFLLMTSSIFIENFCSGLSTAAFFAFLMSLCNHRFSAGQYALLSALAMSGRVFLGPIAGLMVENLGWVQFYLWSFVLCFPGIFFLILLKDKVANYAHVIAE